MLLKIFVFVLLALIINSLFTAWKYIAKGEGNSHKAAKALTVRISLSLLLFIVLVIGLALGLIHK
jgi:hypothetical protein